MSRFKGTNLCGPSVFNSDPKFNFRTNSKPNVGGTNKVNNRNCSPANTFAKTFDLKNLLNSKVGLLSGMVCFVIGLSGCGKNNHSAHRGSQPIPVCTTGINQNVCDTNLVGFSTWLRKTNVVASDAANLPATVRAVSISSADSAVADGTTGGFGQGQVDPLAALSGQALIGSPELNKSKSLTIIHQFKRQRDGSKVWRRSLTVDLGSGVFQTMIIGGRILDVDQEKIRLTLDRSSCEKSNVGFAPIMQPAPEADGSRFLYYARYGENLSFRTRPFPKFPLDNIKGAKNPVDAIGQIFGSIIAGTIGAVFDGTIGALSDVMSQLLTFGLLHDQLKNGEGTFQATDRDQLTIKVKNFSLGTIGCFAPQSDIPGGEFVPASDQDLNW
jgi:hypothetical protein